MANPVDQSTPSSDDWRWKLAANEIKIWRDYSCYDGLPGLSPIDVAQIQKANPLLFQETIDLYKKEPHPIRFNTDEITHNPTELFLRHFSREGLKNLESISEQAFRKFFNLVPPSKIMVHYDGTRDIFLAPGVESFGLFCFTSTQYLNVDGLAQLKQSLLQFFQNGGLHLDSAELSIEVGAIPYTSEFPNYPPYAYQFYFTPVKKCPNLGVS